MDKHYLSIHDYKAFQFFLSLYCKCKQGAFPLMKLLGEWANLETQLSFLEFAVATPESDLLNFSITPRKQARIETIQGIKTNVLPLLSTWCSIDLVEKLLDLSDSPHYMKVRGIFEFPLKNCSEYLLLSIAAAKPKGGQFLLEELYANLLPIFLANHVNSIVVLERLWEINQKLVTRAICNLYKFDPNMMNLSRVLDITQEIKDLLRMILMIEDHDFTIPLGVLAGRRDFLHFDQWMTDRINVIGEPFVEALVNYLDENVIKKCQESGSETGEKRLEKSYLSQEKLAVIFENLMTQKNLPESLMKQITLIHNHAIVLFPNLVAPSNESEAVEEEANRWFQRVFSGEVSVETLIDCMRKYKQSGDAQKTEIYSCMIHNLLDEYRFFNKYPEKELKITGQLFGCIIQNHLIEGLLERISLKYVFEALKRSGKMQRFGVYAIQNFLERLKEWPPSVEAILKMSSLKTNYPDLYQQIYNIYQTIKPAPGAPTINSAGQQGVYDQISPVIPGVESPIPSPNLAAMASSPPFPTSAPTSKFLQQPTYPPNPQQSQTVPPIYQQQYMGNYMYQQPMANPLPQTVPFVWQHGMQPTQHQNLPMMQKGIAPATKREPPLGATSGVTNGSTNYKTLIKGLESRHPGSEYQGHPQNLPTPYLPAIIEGTMKEAKVPIEHQVEVSKTVNPEEEKLPTQSIIDGLTRAFNLMSENDMKNAIDLTKTALVENPHTLNWVADMIAKRAASEQNHHQLFLKFIGIIESKPLHISVLTKTYAAIRQILEANKDNANPSDMVKKACKNLGGFVGMLTIAENKPILAKDLDIKEIIKDAYSKGYIALAIHLVCPLLRQIKNSKVFRPKNPWVRAIFSLIVELLNTQVVSSNLGLRYEINNLFEHLGLKAEDFLPTSILQTRTAVQPAIIKPLPVYQGRHVPPQMTNQIPGPIPGQMRPGSYLPTPQPPGGYRQPSPQPQIGMVIINPEIVKELQALDRNFKESIKQAIEMSIKDILKPVIERSVTIALITTREIILKDFAQEPDDKKLLDAANYMAQSLAGSLAMVTCREPLRMNMGNKIREVFLSRTSNESQQKRIDQIAQALSKDNLEVGSAYIQQSVIIKAKQKVKEDKAIIDAIEKRVADGMKWNSVAERSPLLARLPASLAPRKEGLSPDELNVYSEYSNVLKQSSLNTLIENSEEISTSDPSVQAKAKPVNCKIFALLPSIHEMIENESFRVPEISNNAIMKFQQCLQEVEKNPKVLEQIAQDLFQGCIKQARKMNESAGFIKSKIYIQLLSILCSVYPSLPVKITEQLFKDCENELKYNYEWVSSLIKHSLIDIPNYDIELAKGLRDISTLPHATSSSLLSFVALLVTQLMLAKKILLPANFPQTFTAMNQIHKTPRAQGNKEFHQMLAELEPKAANFKQQSIQLFDEWVSFSQEQSADQVREYFEKLSAHLGNAEDKLNNFFQIISEVAIQHSLSSSFHATPGGNSPIANYPDRLDFRLIDSVLKLLFTMMTGKMIYSDKYFHSFLHALTSLLQIDHNSKLTLFNQRPYYRFFVMILQSLSKAEYQSQVMSELLQNIANAFHDVAPKSCPGFAFAWIDLIAHRTFLPNILGRRTDEKIPSRITNILILLCDMFKFLKLLIVPGEQLSEASKLYFRAAFKITLVLLHDFPDFLALNYFELLRAIPEQYTQLRNIILSAIPFDIKAPEPKRGVKVDKLPEQKSPPRFQSDYKQILKYRNIKEDVDKFLATKTPSLVVDICNKLMSPDPQLHTKRADLEVFHAFILYLAELSVAVIDQNQDKIDITFVLHVGLSKLDVGARDSLLNAMFDEVRYPNTYTHYFMMLLLHIMKESTIPMIQEQIYRILMERLMIQPPHPWGLKILFYELQQNPIYDIENKPFVKNFQEVENFSKQTHDQK